MFATHFMESLRLYFFTSSLARFFFNRKGEVDVGKIRFETRADNCCIQIPPN